MIVTPIKTQPVKAFQFTIEEFLDISLSSFEESQILVVTSKIVSLCEGRVLPSEGNDRDVLVAKEADYYLPREMNKYGFCISINHNTLIASAGIDESNGDGNLILWPEKPQESANRIRDYLVNRFHLSSVGVIITDSHVLPLRWGTVGTCIAHSGFQALNDYRGTPDIFGRLLKVTQSNIAEGLAGSAVVCMGEGKECTPLAIIRDIPLVQFQNRNPLKEELEFLAISKDEDLFSPFLNAVTWKTGSKKK